MTSENILNIEFCHPDNTDKIYTLKWKVARTFAAALWIKNLKKCIDQNIEMRTRYNGFVSGPRDWSFLGNKINKCIQIINGSHKDQSKHIENLFPGKFNQEFSNYIHHYFEILMGGGWKRTEFYLQSSDKVKSAICGLNDIIHEMEALDRAEQTNFENRFHAITTIFHNNKATSIPDICNSEFSLNFNWGDIVLNYSQIGKTWFDLVLDQDEEIFDNAILPLDNITGSFDIFLGSLPDHESLRDKVLKLIASKGLDPLDPKHRIGYLKVASLIGKCTDIGQKKEIINQLTSFTRMKSLSLSNEDKIIFSANLNEPFDLV